LRRISVLRRRLLAVGALGALGVSARAQQKQARVGWLILHSKGMYAELTARSTARYARAVPTC